MEKQNGLRVLNFAFFMVVLKTHHGSERVKCRFVAREIRGDYPENSPVVFLS